MGAWNGYANMEWGTAIIYMDVVGNTVVPSQTIRGGNTMKLADAIVTSYEWRRGEPDPTCVFDVRHTGFVVPHLSSGEYERIVQALAVGKLKVMLYIAGPNDE